MFITFIFYLFYSFKFFHNTNLEERFSSLILRSSQSRDNFFFLIKEKRGEDYI